MTNGYPLCAGTTQSPVNIVAYTTADLPNILSDYDAAALIVQNTSRTFEVASSQFGSMTLNGTTWALSQFHFHAPSEHTLNGVSFGAELHLVHTNASGAIAVIGVLIQEASKDNPALDGIIAALPSAACTNSPQSGTIDPTSLLSPDMDYFQYSGSLTTPPCSPNVSWFVMKQPITASAAQIRALGALSANNRPAQSNLNAIVLKGPR